MYWAPPEYDHVFLAIRDEQGIRPRPPNPDPDREWPVAFHPRRGLSGSLELIETSKASIAGVKFSPTWPAGSRFRFGIKDQTAVPAIAYVLLSGPRQVRQPRTHVMNPILCRAVASQTPAPTSRSYADPSGHGATAIRSRRRIQPRTASYRAFTSWGSFNIRLIMWAPDRLWVIRCFRLVQKLSGSNFGVRDKGRHAGGHQAEDVSG